MSLPGCQDQPRGAAHKIRLQVAPGCSTRGRVFSWPWAALLLSTHAKLPCSELFGIWNNNAKGSGKGKKTLKGYSYTQRELAPQILL